jgi:hypothetical protein
MRNLEKLVTLLQEEVSELKGRVGSLEAQVQLLQIHLSLKEGTAVPPKKQNRPNRP